MPAAAGKAAQESGLSAVVRERRRRIRRLQRHVIGAIS